MIRNGLVDCLFKILTTLSEPQGPTAFETTTTVAQIAVAAASAIIAALAVIVSKSIVGRDNRLAQQRERDKIRERLRTWFGGLSRSATNEIREGHRRLDSRIKEDVNPLRNRDVFKLMQWAELIHTTTHKAEDIDPTLHDRMHAERMYAKWMFRDALAEWVLRPRKGQKMMGNLSNRGYLVIEELDIDDPKDFALSMRPYEPSI
ncbi:hypothetical protein [Glaciihabitans sp. GrIS 2.15]|uniref:hypothetical protein n=1 Tax=Glaciihabitans sp. GrIS 2.15 TaxID=3071710 RepID=UPI002E0189AB|nr:hypothetical protein [Glaciihabitans sp. GrIS 2.15]